MLCEKICPLDWATKTALGRFQPEIDLNRLLFGNTISEATIPPSVAVVVTRFG